MCKPPSPFRVSAELAELARRVAPWAAPATGTIVYVYGSRVRGDHRMREHRVDICVEFPETYFRRLSLVER